MRRRRGDSGDVPPPELLVFEGHGYRTAEAWSEAYSQWCRARETWFGERGLWVPLPAEIHGDCPFDWAEI